MTTPTTKMQPEDHVWLAILHRTPGITEKELRDGGFPNHIIEAWKEDSPDTFRWKEAVRAHKLEREKRQMYESDFGLSDAPLHASAVLLVRGDQIALAQRSADAKAYPGAWECPAGKAEPGETPRETAARELMEEAGLTPGLERLLPCGVLRFRRPPGADVAMSLFVLDVHPWEEPQNTEPTKRAQWNWVALRTELLDDPSLTFASRELIAVALFNRGAMP